MPLDSHLIYLSSSPLEYSSRKAKSSSSCSRCCSSAAACANIWYTDDPRTQTPPPASPPASAALSKLASSTVSIHMTRCSVLVIDCLINKQAANRKLGQYSETLRSSLQIMQMHSTDLAGHGLQRASSHSSLLSSSTFFCLPLLLAVLNFATRLFNGPST